MRVLVNVMEDGRIEPVVFEVTEVSLTNEVDIVLNEGTSEESLHVFTAPYILQILDMQGEYMYIPSVHNPEATTLLEVLRDGYADLRQYGLCVYAPDESDLMLMQDSTKWERCNWVEEVINYGDMA